MKLPVYSRADRWRAAAIVAPFLTAVSTGAAVREFHADDTRVVE
jgi:hypothetical protein